MAAQQFNNKKNRLASKLRLITKKLVKPVTSLLFKRKPAQTEDKAQQVKPQLNTISSEAPLWMHPSNLKESQYIRQYEDENAANEALEAKLRELIVNEYSQRAPQQTVSLRIEGHLTIIPSVVSPLDPTMAGTFWTADADICWREHHNVSTYSTSRQRAERQTPVAY